MGCIGIAAALLVPSKLEPKHHSFYLHSTGRRRSTNKNKSIVPVARLFGPSVFEASKLKVLFLEVDEEKHPPKLPRAYTLTHSDVTSYLTLAISHTINISQLQGWYHRLQRDEVVAEWKKIRGKMSLHVHCHISGGHFLLNLCARLRYIIFSKELPLVLKAFVHGDEKLFNNYPELQESLTWVYFHSDIQELNKVECWGPLKVAASPSGGTHVADQSDLTRQFDGIRRPCPSGCTCCFPSTCLISWTHNLSTKISDSGSSTAAEEEGLDQNTISSRDE